jgi:hypothetical protein
MILSQKDDRSMMEAGVAKWNSPYDLSPFSFFRGTTIALCRFGDCHALPCFGGFYNVSPKCSA